MIKCIMVLVDNRDHMTKILCPNGKKAKNQEKTGALLNKSTSNLGTHIHEVSK